MTENYHSDFQPQRLNTPNFSGKEEEIKTIEIYDPLYKLLNLEFSISNQFEDANNNIKKSIVLISKKLSFIFDDFKKNENDNEEIFEEFLAYYIILKQARSAYFISNDVNKWKDFDSATRTSFHTEKKFNELIEKIINCSVDRYSKGQKYINCFAVPVMFFNDCDSYDSKFWNQYVEKVANTIYSTFKKKAILRLTNEAIVTFDDKIPQNIRKISKDSESSNLHQINTYESQTFNDMENQTQKEKEKDKEGVNNSETAEIKIDLPTALEKCFYANKQNLYDFDDLDYSPILTETNISCKYKEANSQEISHRMMNLSFDLSHKLIDFFKKDLENISEIIKDEKNINLCTFKIAASLIEMLKLASALLYEDGADIPPLSFIWKRIDGFKVNFANSFYTFIEKNIIDLNVPFNFSRNSFIIKKDSDDSNIHNIIDKFKKSLFSDENKENEEQIINKFFEVFDEDFGIDFISFIASIIGKKRTNEIVLKLIKKLKDKTQDFCQEYGRFIPSFNFNIGIDNESQNIYVLKQYFNSFVNYFSLSDPKAIASSISKIGNIIALIILFDSAVTSEFIPKEMISAAISSLTSKSEFLMYLSNPNLKNPNLSNHRHNYLSNAISEIYIILNTPNTREFFEQIDGHSGFYQFAIALIYASVHKPEQNQSNFYPTDSISITCSIFLEVLSQYHLYSFSNIIHTFILFKENMDTNNGFPMIENNINDLLDDSSQSKLQINLQIVDIFHYALSRSSFPKPNHLILSKYTEGYLKSIELCHHPEFNNFLQNRCNMLAILLDIEKIDIFIKDLEELKERINTSIALISITPVIDNKYNKTTYDLHILPIDLNNAFKEDSNSLISIIRNITHKEYGDFLLVIYRKPPNFIDSDIHDFRITKEFLLNLRGNFPLIIEDERFLTPKKGTNPMSLLSSPKNYFYPQSSEDY